MSSGSRHSTIHVALAQVDCALGDVEENARRAREAIARAARGRGRPRRLPRAEPHRLRARARARGRRAHPRRPDRDRPRRGGRRDRGGARPASSRAACTSYNSAMFLDGGEIVHVQRKTHLPTYGRWEESKHYSQGAVAAGVRHAPRPLRRAHLQRRLAGADGLRRRPRRRAAADRAGVQLARAAGRHRPGGARARLGRPRALPRALPPDVGRVRQPRGRGGGDDVLGRLAGRRPLGPDRRAGPARRARHRPRRARRQRRPPPPARDPAAQGAAPRARPPRDRPPHRRHRRTEDGRRARGPARSPPPGSGRRGCASTTTPSPPGCGSSSRARRRGSRPSRTCEALHAALLLRLDRRPGARADEPGTCSASRRAARGASGPSATASSPRR